MSKALDWLFSDQFIPHGHCYLWRPDVLWLHVVSDGVIAASYYAIPAVIFYFVRRRGRAIPYWWIPVLFGLFIGLCGSTHLLGIWTVWRPDYVLDGLVKALTAGASAATALALVWIAPRALALRTPLELEAEVAARTAELSRLNAQLREQIDMRQRTEATLRESEERYRLAMDALAGFIYEADADGSAAHRSSGMPRIVGYATDEVPATSDWWLAQVHPEDGERVRATIGAALGGDAESYAIEYRVRHRRGEWVWVWDHAMIVRDAAGRARRVVGNVLDVTARKQAELALVEADQRKDEFLATLAHELRNPLAPIRTAAHLLKSAALSEPQREQARDMIERQVAHMVHLVDDLLDVSRITRGRISLRRVRQPLEAAVRQALETALPVIEEHGHQLEVTIGPEPVQVDVDATRIAQSVLNLLSNAARYTPRGGHIVLFAGREGGDAVVRVRDDGIGIPGDMLGRVFEMFVQGGEPGSQVQGGLGIGLALTRRLVELHGGSVEAASDGPGRGSEFTIRLPVAR